MTGGEIIERLTPHVGHAVELLSDTRDRIAKLDDTAFRALQEQLAAEPADEVTALISSICLHESAARYLKLTPSASANA